MANINDFKATLKGGGARANQFSVTLPFPGFAAVGGETRVMSFLCKATNLPGMTLGEVPVPFRGRNLYIAGDRTFDTWTTTIFNDTNFLIRNAMERWSNGINDLANNTGVVSPADYQTDLEVEQLDRDDAVLKTYKFISAWPTGVTAIELTSEAADAIETFDVTWRYQHFTTSGVSVDDVLI